ncbi:MAG: hypothetical protein ACK4P1_02510, partial [Aggregatilineales bacterium]
MPRRYRPQRRPVLPDIRYNSVLVGMLINRMMYSGKKAPPAASSTKLWTWSASA